MTADGDGDRSNMVDPTSSDSESIDSLLAELLGPEFAASETWQEGSESAEGIEDHPMTSYRVAEMGRRHELDNLDEIPPLDDVDAGDRFSAIDEIIGSEDPTVAFPEAMPAIEDVFPTVDAPVACGTGNTGKAVHEDHGVDTAVEIDAPDEPDPIADGKAGAEARPEVTVGRDAVESDVSRPSINADAAAGATARISGNGRTAGDKPVVSAGPATAGSSRARVSKPRPVSAQPPTPVAVVRSARRRRSGSSFGRLVKVGVLTVLSLYVLVVAAWGIDVAGHQSLIMRGVSLEGSSISGMSADKLREVLDARQADLAATPLDVVVDTTTITTDPVTLGASIDQDEVVAEALEIGRRGFFLTRPISWVGRILGGRDLKTQYQYDAEVTAGAAQSVVAVVLDQPKEPELVLDGNEQLVVEPGNSGTTISPRELVGRLPSVVEAGPPYRVDLQAMVADPRIDQDALETVAAEINESTAEPVRIQVLDESADIDPLTLKSWTVIDTTEGTVTWTIDQQKVLVDLRPLFPELGSEDQKARFTVVDGDPVIVPASETVICCDEESVATIRPLLAEPVVPVGDDQGSDADGDPIPSRTIVLEPTVVGFDEGVAELESLGIVEEISTFTTNHPCCQNRVKNIQRFADLMQGVIIRPGETFSLNEHVGQRTIEKGFVADGAINLGVLEPQVGGGISQYATTFFNAAFFAGLEFVEYQSHSLYISRYPRGREATISWRTPDLKVRNGTPYGILVWNDYTSTSITVTFYSTKHLKIEALPLRRSSERQCRVDITPRLITYPDGTQTEDTVYAVYRPGEGLDCNGNSTRPEEDQPAPPTATTTTAVLPDPEPDPGPGPEPDPDPPVTSDGDGNG